MLNPSPNAMQEIPSTPSVIETYAGKPPIDSEFTVYCDGATFQANPSSCGGIGFSVFANGMLYRAYQAQLVGVISNNVAELNAIIRALRWCHSRGMVAPTIISDSELAIGFCTGRNTPKNPGMIHLVSYINHRLRWMQPTFKHVPRNHPHQSLSDFLANLGIFADADYDTFVQRTALLEAFKEWKRR